MRCRIRAGYHASDVAPGMTGRAVSMSPWRTSCDPSPKHVRRYRLLTPEFQVQYSALFSFASGRLGVRF
jgi:hypothetical protein